MSTRLYGQEFYDSQILGSLQSAQAYLYFLFSLWGVPACVVDVGCGRGAWLATCRDFGVARTVGIDGNWNSQEAMLDPRIEFYPADLETTLPVNGPFDLAISLEVAEHLQPAASDDFVASLCRLSDAVLFGAAFTGQPGVNHINTRPHSFWAAKFATRGYEMFDLFRPVFWNDDRVEPCYRQNTFLYVKPGHPLHQALLQRGYTTEWSALIDSVHPAVYLGLLHEYTKLLGMQPPPPQTGIVASRTDALPATQEQVAELIAQADMLQRENRLDDAERLYRRVLNQEPDHAECLLRLTHLLLMMQQREEAFSLAQHLVHIAPDLAFGQYLAGYIARELGYWQQSRPYLLRAITLDPMHLFARVLCCMSAFTVCGDEAERLSTLSGYATELAKLILDTPLATADRINAAANGIGAMTPFFLPYLGSDVTELQRQYGTWVCSILAAQHPGYCRPVPRRAATGRIRVGIVSHYFQNHSNWKIPIKGWLEQLDRRKFSLHCYHTGETADECTEAARAMADTFLQASDVDRLAAEIHGQQCDVLLYPGIGMDTVTLKLAALRLAPVQCASWGHPVTTGMPTVDYYLSSDLMEPPDGEQHYTETLVRLPNLSIWYDPPAPDVATTAPLAIPGLGRDDVVFLCCQNLLKYLPCHDDVFPALAAQAKTSRFVFIASQIAELTKKFRYRLEHAFQTRGMNAADHVTMLPYLDAAGFSALNARADIFLDSIDWSGCNTVFESLPFNKPIVTLPGPYMRGRHAAAILRMMGIEETIAASVDDYVAIAARLANDRQWRDDMSNRIARNKHKVYCDLATIAALEQFITAVSGRSHCDS